MGKQRMLRLEDKMAMGKRRVLINHLVTGTTDKIAYNYEMWVNCFARTDCLANFVKSEADDLNNPQAMTSKICMLDSYSNNEETVEHAAPSTVITPEEEELGSIIMDIYKEETANNNNSLITHEDTGEADLELRSVEEIEDISAAESVEMLDQFYD